MSVRNKFPLNRFPALGFAVVALLAASACAPVPPVERPVPVKPQAYEAPKAPPGCTAGQRVTDTQQGTASWYGETHHGRLTASGEPFDMHGMTAAHRTLAFGTRIRVTNDDNGRSVELTVTDRGPFIEGRILDVTHRAAQQLAFKDDGLATVQLEVLGPC